MEEVFGKLIKVHKNRVLQGFEIYGVIELSNGKLLDFIVESNYSDGFIESVTIGEHYILKGEVSEMDQELWEDTFEDYPWNRPEDILFVNSYKSGKEIADTFIF